MRLRKSGSDKMAKGMLRSMIRDHDKCHQGPQITRQKEGIPDSIVGELVE